MLFVRIRGNIFLQHPYGNSGSSSFELYGNIQKRPGSKQAFSSITCIYPPLPFTASVAWFLFGAIVSTHVYTQYPQRLLPSSHKHRKAICLNQCWCFGFVWFALKAIHHLGCRFLSVFQYLFAR